MLITNNDFQGNQTASITNNSTGANNVVANNIT
jgi:hypothetical protein